MSMNFAGWQSAQACTSGPADGATALLNWMRANYSMGWSGGIFNCRTVRGSQQPSIHGEGRALDWMMPVVNGRGHPAGHDAVKRLASKGRELGIQAIIFDRQIWSARSPNGRPYTGVHPHFDHLHIELTREAGRTLTVARLNALLNGGVPARIVVSPYPTVRSGASGDTVKDLQRLLNGQTSHRLKVDGKFGPLTDRAVRDFQRANGLRVDGIVGRETWTALTRPAVAPAAPTTKRNVIRRGDTGFDVKALQKRLNIPDDGIFGPNTDAAVRQFQRLSGLVVDGIVGPATWGALGLT